MKKELLHVISPLSNPVRWENRIKLYQDFEEHMLDSGVCLTTVECAYGDRPFVLPERCGVNRVQVRAKTLVWNKENLINIGLSRLPVDWKYVAWIDADIMFRRSSWAEDTVHALQQYDVIQPWDSAYDLGPNDEHLQHHKSFLCQWWNNKPLVKPSNSPFWRTEGGSYDFPHPGYAWAANREALDNLGGLIETAILGAGDHHMALALIGEVQRSIPKGLTQGYANPLIQWQERALRHVNLNLGYLKGTIEHFWHGRKSDRRYTDRWKILLHNQFDPVLDLKKNCWGVNELNCNKPKLRKDLDHYFRQRNEDSNIL